MTAGACVSDLHEVSKSYRQARQTLQIASQLGTCPPIIKYDDLGIYRFLLDTRSREDLTQFASRTLGPILEYQEHYKLGLLDTVEAYLRHNCNIVQAAKECHLHPNTVRYRLERVADLCSVDFSNIEYLLELSLALKVYRLLGKEVLLLEWFKIRGEKDHDRRRRRDTKAGRKRKRR